MGNLTRGSWTCFLFALLIMSGSHVAADFPNDHVWIARFDPSATTGAASPIVDVPGGFRTAVASWNVTTPPGSWIETELRARVRDRWTKWYAMGVWSAGGAPRHSVAKQGDADGTVDTDTLELVTPADAFEIRVTAHSAADGSAPALRLLAVATSLGDAPETDNVTTGVRAMDLDVPQQTQRVATSPDAKGGGGDSWCSPASISMVMAYWAKQRKHPEWNVDVTLVADGVYDPVYDGCGNWPFNVAYASEHALGGWVRQFASLDDVAHLIARGFPVIASIAVKPGELDGAPYPKTAGHLLVIRGFTESGDVIVNDPYGQPGEIRRVYRRAQFAHAWLGGSNGTVYLIAPPGQLESLR